MSTSNDLKYYFDREWQRFQTDVKVFAQTYPEQAGHLHLESPVGRDPNIDHLLQGCTYLAAQIHKRIDEESNSLPAQLALQLWPQLAECVPSMSVAVFQLKSLMAKSHVIEAGTALVSEPLGDEGVVCQFETVADFPIYPFHIESVSLNHAASTLSCVFNSSFDRPIVMNTIASLPCFLADEYAKAVELYFYMRHCHKISLKVGSHQFDQIMSIRFPLNAPLDSLRHGFRSGLLAHQILFDYFSFYQSYLFFELDGFSDLKCLEAKQFEVTFHFDVNLSEDFRVSSEDIKMNACVIVNQTSVECNPIKYDHAHYRYPVYPDSRKATPIHLLRIEEVQSINCITGRITHYLPLHQCDDPSAPSYTVSREMHGDQDNKVYLSCFGGSQQTEIVSVNATVCQGFYPKRYVQKKGLSLVKSSLSAMCHGMNILVPSKMLMPPAQLMSQTFIRYFTLNLNSLLEVNVLKQLLRTLNWTTESQHKRRIEGLLSIKSKTSSHMSKGTFFHVTDIQLQVDQACYVSSADIYFFGDMLHAFFSAQASLCQMVSLSIAIYPSEEVFEWKPVFGQKTVV